MRQDLLRVSLASPCFSDRYTITRKGHRGYETGKIDLPPPLGELLFLRGKAGSRKGAAPVSKALIDGNFEAECI
jgi:hypothetical protein